MSVAELSVAPFRRPGSVPLLAAGGVVLLGAVAVVSPALAIGLVGACGFVFVAFRSLAASLALFTLLISLEHVPALEAGITFVKLAGGVLVAAWGVQLLRRRRELPLLLRERPLLTAGALGLVVWALASALWAADSGLAISSALRLGQGIVLVFIVYSALRAPHQLRWLLGAYVVSALLAAAFGLATGAGEAGRLGGGVGNPNELAAFLLPAVMVCAFMPLGERRPLLRWAVFVTGFLLLLALFMTGSRGALVGLAVALLAAVAVAGPGRLRMIAVALVVFGAGGAYYVTSAPPDQVDRIASLREDGGTGRSDLWAVAVEMTRDRPVTGIGAGNFPVVEAQYAARELSISRIDLVLDESKVAHNTYLSFLSQLGFVGLALFGVLAVAALASGVRALRELGGAPWELQQLVRGFVVGLLGLLVAFTFSSAEYEKHLWLLLGAAFALPSLAARRASADPDGGHPGGHDDYHRVMREPDRDGVFGHAPDLSGIGVERRRLVRREAALAEREQAIARHEQELRRRAPDRPAAEIPHATPQADDGSSARSLARLEAALAERSAALTGIREELEAVRGALEELASQRAADEARVAAAETGLLEAEERAAKQRQRDAAQKAKLRSQLKQLQERLEQSEDEGRQTRRRSHTSSRGARSDEDA